MTVRTRGYTRMLTGSASDAKPILCQESSQALPEGSEFWEIAGVKRSYFDGTSWYSTKRYYLDDRVDIAITTTSSHLYSGDALTKYGDLLRQYTIELSASTNAPTRILSVTDANNVAVWTSTAITGTTGTVNITRLLPTSEQVILGGSYTVVWTLSTNSATTGITDYYTFGFDRG